MLSCLILSCFPSSSQRREEGKGTKCNSMALEGGGKKGTKYVHGHPKWPPSMSMPPKMTPLHLGMTIMIDRDRWSWSSWWSMIDRWSSFPAFFLDTLYGTPRLVVSFCCLHLYSYLSLVPWHTSKDTPGHLYYLILATDNWPIIVVSRQSSVSLQYGTKFIALLQSARKKSRDDIDDDLDGWRDLDNSFWNSLLTTIHWLLKTPDTRNNFPK